ncbi:MAG: DUF3127 domain-containing protein [Bacteroidia bacterium]|nr:DUF3127 domain-containing protein [Bacteroidia bacterium]
MTLELEGRIKTKLQAQSGNGARGTWVRQDFVLEYQDGNYPAEACFSAWGQDRVDELARFQQGDQVKVSFNIKAREYSGRWYNDLRVWRITAGGVQQAPAPARQAAPQAYPASQSAPSYSAPAPTIDDMPADLGINEDDLPF